MTSKRDVRFSSDSKTWSHWGFVCGLALLMGCAAPATREQAPAPDHSTRSAQPAAAPAPAEAQPAGTAHAAEPAPPAAAPHQQSAEDLAAKDGPMSDADREALAELIRAQVMAAQAERASHEPEPASPKPQTEGATPKEALAAPAVRNEQPSAAAQLSRGDHVPSTAPSTAPGAPAATSGARMKLSPSEFDFKEVWQSQPAEGEFSIENVGTEPLTLDTRSSCGCTVATKLKSPLDPGETTKFKISYNTSRPGQASKTVTVTTNDPEHPSVVIRVSGTVKGVVAATPSDRIALSDLDTDAVETRTIQLESQYPTPLNLKLRENQNLGPFTVELRELEPGKRYRLTVTTKPPLPVNLNSATVLVETGLEQVPTVPIYLSANVPAPVMAVPGRLNVPAGATHPTEQVLQINCRGTPPVQVTDVKCNVDAVKWEMLPAEPPAAESKTRTYRLRVTLPPYEELPAGGATLQIFTSAAEQQYKQLDVPIVRMRAPAPPRATSAPQRPSVPTGKKAG